MPAPFTPVIQGLPDTVPFVGPEELERTRGEPFKARLGANESAFGISPLAEAALHDAIGIQGCSWYADPLSYTLRSTLASRLDVPMEHLCVDAGIDTLLGLTARMYIEPGNVLVTSRGAYPTVNYHVVGCGGVIQTVPYKDNHEDTEALAEAAHQHKARLVYLSNPDNPMGTRVSASAIQTLIAQLPENCVLLLDEAYFEFMPQEDVLAMDVASDNVIRFRTFSKAYGMAGMRIGYAVAHPIIIKGYDKIRNHFGLNRLAQIAASASLDDTAMLPRIQKDVHAGRQKIYDLAHSLQLAFIESSTNFVAVDIGSSERASRLLQLLNDKGIFMRKPMQPPQDRYIRVGVGLPTEHEYLSESLPGLLNSL